MKLDIVFVTYNSEKWIDNCINSILKSKYDLKNVSLYFYMPYILSFWCDFNDRASQFLFDVPQN